MSEDEEYVPRRLRRFQREEFTPTEEEVKSKGTEIAMKEVDKFKDVHERYPQKEELNEISKNVFEQLKTDISENKNEDKKIVDSIEFGFDEEEQEVEGTKKSFLEERKAKRKMKNAQSEKEPSKKEKIKSEKSLPKKETIQTPPAKEVTSGIKDLFAEEAKTIENTKNVNQLAEIDELGKLESELSEENDFDLIEKETEGTVNNCAFCNSKAKAIIYCPNCGQAFCDHCAKTIDVQKDFVRYTCPKCANEFKKRRNI